MGKEKIRGKPKRDREGKEGKARVTAAFIGKDGSIIREDDWHGWQCGRAHEVGEGRE
jgi:hypothetical protein